MVPPAMGAIFDPAELHDVARGALDVPTDALVPHIAAALERRYPGHVRTPREWIFNNAGGAMGMMAILHASITEYLIVFGSPIGTEGHSGRFHADDWFFILKGEQWAYAEGEMERSVYRPGDMHHLPRGAARGYRIPDHCWALEYARGNIPSMLPFGLADAFTSTLDFRTIRKLFRLYGGAVIAELLRGKV
jgi:C-8 sterol isomerase